MTLLLAHLSDAHIGPLPQPRRHELWGKRITGYLNWKSGRDRTHDMDVLARLVNDIKAQQADHIAMTGDILNIGLPAEFPLARNWLQSLGDTHDVSFVPGNHDAYVKSAMPNLIRTFAPWTTGDDESAHFPYLRVRGDVALIGLSSGIPTPLFLASGRIGRAQRERFATLLRETKRSGLMRLVMLHHPPHSSGGSPGRGLIDARAFEAIIAQEGADLIIHGHNHRSQVKRMKGPGEPVPVIGVASASAIPGSPRHRAAYHLYRIGRASQGWRIDVHVRGLIPGTRDIGDLGLLPLAATFDTAAAN